MRTASLLTVLVISVAATTLAACSDKPKPPPTQPLPSVGDSEVKLGIGVQLVGAGRYQEALGLFEQILAVDPTNEKAKFNQAAMFAQLGRTQEAMAAFDGSHV